MFIKTLRICDTVNGVLMREVPFHMGANFVVDTDNSPRHNKVGKTTFLKLIDILMGAQNKSLIYTDSETGSVTPELRKIITDRRVAAEMTVAKSLTEPHCETHDLRVDLFPRGGYYIDGERMSSNAYRAKLDGIFFGIDDNVPTFRQLINSFVRVSVAGDDDSFLHTLTRASNATYRSVYNFLFGISDPRLDSKLSELKKELNHTQESLRQYKRVTNVTDIDEQRQILVALENEYNRTKSQISDIFDSEDYKANREAIAKARAEYARLTDELNSINYKIQRNDGNLESARAERSRQADPGITRKFYDEVCSLLPSLNRTFDDMVDFNEKLVDNKISYFKLVGVSLQEQVDAISAQRDKLLDDNSQFLSLVETDKIDEYEQLSDTLMRLKQDIGKRAEIVDTLDRYDRDIARITDEIGDYSTDGSKRSAKGGDYQTMMSSFNFYFTPLASEINGESPILVYLPDTEKFPIQITDISGTSTGTRKSLIASFDLAYQSFAAEHHMAVPHFVVHDVVENIEGDNLRAIIDAANESGAQYIVAALKEKLDSSGISEAEQASLSIVQLAEDDRLFDGKSVNGKSNEVASLLKREAA